jgi:hypothetical protein
MVEGMRYREGDQIFTYEELREATEEQIAGFPPESWRDGVFNFDDYLIESLHTGTIIVVDDEDESR